MLLKIVERKREEVAQLRAATSMAKLLQEAKEMQPAKGFGKALLHSSRPVSVIAEVKKASPSKGLIRPDFDPVAIAQSYAAAEVECMSVLTDTPFFQGSKAYLKDIRKAVSQPLLRKDFMIDPLQVVEARACGADCILLIAAILDGPQLKELAETATELGMDYLIEVHDRRELESVFQVVTPTLLGINNRNLHTFQTDLAATSELAALVPAGIPIISESGINSVDCVAYVQEAGARAILVGEHFMRQKNVTQAVLDLVGKRAENSEQVRL
ncbi:indole-3-glycerol phosphate synthase TrpC [Brevibacillus borstelensis]|uniref:indole-3-glycerol phosphate synthase TrpC n=1 Tax=Brevibacillus borstelensis TaxID=45462 RepID=UPI000F08D7B5|nr:indole-3-glycerol phosphate synthase TrpC [Brevibacillus borstelensis]MED1882606.1 indole-3-glycerol phosphate synthase TrpC [Brevibacillus borstelensis]RNB62245.1 indole-3-glycerol phosphate synthase TrpC [Brevibacillus borstelensis]GED51665.1 indole-3-glycerol phosphate synthase [Brevibacillus borstelensis]